MGLDSFWMNESNERVSVEGQFKVCGGMLSDHGNSSFRGKVYDEMIAEVTGVSLYQEEINANTVKEMAEKLKQINWNSQFGFKFDIDSDEFNSVVQMFVAHAAEGHKLIGWW